MKKNYNINVFIKHINFNKILNFKFFMRTRKYQAFAIHTKCEGEDATYIYDIIPSTSSKTAPWSSWVMGAECERVANGKWAANILGAHSMKIKYTWISMWRIKGIALRVVSCKGHLKIKPPSWTHPTTFNSNLDHVL